MQEGLLPNFSEARRAGMLPAAADDVSVACRRWRGRRSAPARIRRATTSSTSSIAIGAPTCRCCRRRTSARSSGSCGSAATASRCTSRSCACLRKSKPFWTILGEHRIWSTVLRVPITFPPDRFYGAELSAMCVPDLLGTQGTFLLFTTRPAGERFKEGGLRVPVDRRRRSHRDDGRAAGEHASSTARRRSQVPLRIALDRARRRARVRSGRRRSVDAEPGALSDWVTLTFPAAPGVKVVGDHAPAGHRDGRALLALHVARSTSIPKSRRCRSRIRRTTRPTSPSASAPYSTLGLAEDTWALNEGVTDDGTFLQQTYDIDREREAMFFAALDRLRRGSLVCVFDATDRIQHMFWRYIEPDHPAARGREDAPHRDAIRELYRAQRRAGRPRAWRSSATATC